MHKCDTNKSMHHFIWYWIESIKFYNTTIQLCHQQPMKIITWNVNGLRTLKNFQQCVSFLDPDVLCLQETKISRSQLGYNYQLSHIFPATFPFVSKKNWWKYQQISLSMKNLEEHNFLSNPLKFILNICRM